MLKAYTDLMAASPPVSTTPKKRRSIILSARFKKFRNKKKSHQKRKSLMTIKEFRISTKFIREGYLFKKSRHLKAYRYRYCALAIYDNELELQTYKKHTKKSMSHPTETIVISSISNKNNSLFQFTLNNYFHFKALNELDYNAWIKIIQENIKKLLEQSQLQLQSNTNDVQQISKLAAHSTNQNKNKKRNTIPFSNIGKQSKFRIGDKVKVLYDDEWLNCTVICMTCRSIQISYDNVGFQMNDNDILIPNEWIDQNSSRIMTKVKNKKKRHVKSNSVYPSSIAHINCDNLIAVINELSV